ncbi:translation initiation factor 2 [Streptomyces sp. NPDC052396]|uniref:translation initiation factor 2 n=1 Tax=Streptomyces sp. NPDC052396 TaxID=3365689 RepID=UPI0037D38360
METGPAGSGQRAAGSGQRAAGSGQRAAGSKSVLFAVRSAAALHRLLDVLPVFAGDRRVRRLFTLVPGSDFDLGALAALEHAGARTLPWAAACRRSFDLILAASPKGELHRLDGPLVLLPHGAGFNKTVPKEGSDGLASGLDPVHLLAGGRALAAVHALAHPSQVARLAEHSPEAAARATVTGDPTLDRLLQSVPHRDAYRAALGTGGRRLIVLTSTWGPESLLATRPDLPARLAAGLPWDTHQLALIVHPNDHSSLGGFDLAEQLAPALAAGMILARPYEEWAAVLVAADAVLTDHGSAALYAAALDRPVIAAGGGGAELIPGSPMDRLLGHSPRLTDPRAIDDVLRAHRPGSVRALTQGAFAEQGRALELLRREGYAQLGLAPPPGPVTASPLPRPEPPARRPSAFAVRTERRGREVRVERFPAHLAPPARHLAAEYGVAGERQVRSAGLLYLRAGAAEGAGHGAGWTAGGWTGRILAEHPACRMAAVILPSGECLARPRGGDLLWVRAGFCASQGGRVVLADPAAVLSAVYAAVDLLPGELRCVLGDHVHRVRGRGASRREGERVLVPA